MLTLKTFDEFLAAVDQYLEEEHGYTSADFDYDWAEAWISDMKPEDAAEQAMETDRSHSRTNTT